MNQAKCYKNSMLLFCAFAAHVHSRGPEGNGDSAGSQEEDCQVCQGESAQAGGHVGRLPPLAQTQTALVNQVFLFFFLNINENRLHARRLRSTKQRSKRSARLPRPHRWLKPTLITLGDSFKPAAASPPSMSTTTTLKSAPGR